MDGNGLIFDLPVDRENKALTIKPLAFRGVHQKAFHLSWLGFFVSFVSTVRYIAVHASDVQLVSALIPVIREDLGLDKQQLGDAGIAAVTGTIAARVAMGSVCDAVGPRAGMSAALLLVAPFVFAMALASSSLDFIFLRFGIGFGLATFVACHFWTTQMFNVKIVGAASSTACGWGNMGGGAVQLLMPMVYAGFVKQHEPFVAWRWAFFAPGFLHIVVGMLILFFSQDLPDGQYAMLKKNGAMKTDSGTQVFKNALLNYRTWILMIVYGLSFGVELTINNIIVTYLHDSFHVELTTAGVLGSLFGFMNLFARTIGGLGSDYTADVWGMRGRLWWLWITQTLQGLTCVAMGLLSGSLAGSIVIMIAFSLFVQASEGAAFGVVPFVSKRSLGVVSGLVGAGGNAGSAILQALFFKSNDYTDGEGLVWMGVTTIAITALVGLIYFPMWGGLFFGPKAGVTEEDYYFGEYNDEERAAGLADQTVKFAMETKSQRGLRRLEFQPYFPEATQVAPSKILPVAVLDKVAQTSEGE